MMMAGEKRGSCFSLRDVGSENQRSEKAFVFLCGPCMFDNTEADGVSYCRVCKEFLCRDCLKAHQKSRASRDHRVFQGAELHQVQTQHQTLEFESCLYHSEKVLEFYCEIHDCVLCKECKTITHRRCEGVRNIRDVCRGIKGGQEADNFSRCVETLMKKLKSLYEERTEDLASVRQQKKNCLEEITDLRSVLNKLLDKLEADMKQELQKNVNKETEEISDHQSSLQTGIESLSTSQKNLSEANSLGGDQQIFIAMKRVDIEKIEDMVNEIQREKQTVKFGFQVHAKLQPLLSALQNLGNLTVVVNKNQKARASSGGSIHSEAATCTGSSSVLNGHQRTRRSRSTDFTLSPSPLSPLLPYGLKDMDLVSLGEFSLQEPGDTNPCTITGATFLPGGDSILCDNGNNKIKLLDANLKLKTCLKLKTGPWDVAMVTSEKVIVSLPQQRMLLYMTFAHGLNLGHTVAVRENCYGVVVCNSQIFVTCHDRGNGVVLILTLQGVIQRRVGENPDGSYLFSWPYYVAVDEMADHVYVSEGGQNKVTCLNRDGGVEYTYKDRELRGPKKLMVDCEGNVFLCGHGSNTLQVISPERYNYRTLLTPSDGLRSPFTFCFRSYDNTLLVGMTNTIQVYRFV